MKLFRAERSARDASVGAVPRDPKGGADLRIEEISKTYVSETGERTAAVDGFSTIVRAGEFVSLLGPSGCGKTTLLKLLAGLIEPTEGSLVFGERRGHVPTGEYGMAFQSSALLPWRTVLDNILLPQQLLGLKRQEYEERAAELLALVQLEGVENKYPGELSGGMQQRVSLVRALIHDPSTLLMDEPFAALDALTREDLGQALQRLHMKEHKTVVFVTHSIGEALTLSDRVFVFSRRPARVVGEIVVDLPRPRGVDAQASSRYHKYEAHIRSLLHEHAA